MNTRLASSLLPRTLAAICAIALLGGCFSLPASSDATRFYVLSAPGAPPSPERAVDIVVRRAALPEYLDTSSLLVRQSDHQLRYESGHRWSGSLDTMIADALADSLSRTLPDLNVTAGSLQRAPLSLLVRVLRFEALPGGVVEVGFDWRLSKEGQSQGEGLDSGRIIRRGSWDQSDFEQLVSELSRLLDEAGKALAEQVAES